MATFKTMFDAINNKNLTKKNMLALGGIVVSIGAHIIANLITKTGFNADYASLKGYGERLYNAPHISGPVTGAIASSAFGYITSSMLETKRHHYDDKFRTTQEKKIIPIGLKPKPRPMDVDSYLHVRLEGGV